MLELTDKGFISVKIGDAERELDCFAVNNRLADIGRISQGKPLDAYLSAIVEYLGELGWPNCSHWLAGQFVKAVTKAVESLGNEEPGESKPDSPGSTVAESSP